MKKPHLNGWEGLICTFFGPTCRRVLGQYFEMNGFTEVRENEIGGVWFSRFGVFLEISYELETVPQTLSVVIGVGENKYESPSGHPCCVPYWYLLPRVDSQNQSGLVGFKTESELETLLGQIKDNVLEPYAKPLWNNIEKLEVTIANFRSEFSC